ncbi:MAG: hypothetical protein PF450_04540 [Bacteroidales bacterium]|jgi:hypothetical protein|nr:hypothetical protein [Bacteroidales bacterium]
MLNNAKQIDVDGILNQISKSNVLDFKVAEVIKDLEKPKVEEKVIPEEYIFYSDESLDSIMAAVFLKNVWLMKYPERTIKTLKVYPGYKKPSNIPTCHKSSYVGVKPAFITDSAVDRSYYLSEGDDSVESKSVLLYLIDTFWGEDWSNNLAGIGSKDDWISIGYLTTQFMLGDKHMPLDSQISVFKVINEARDNLNSNDGFFLLDKKIDDAHRTIYAKFTTLITQMIAKSLSYKKFSKGKEDFFTQFLNVTGELAPFIIKRVSLTHDTVVTCEEVNGLISYHIFSRSESEKAVLKKIIYSNRSNSPFTLI